MKTIVLGILSAIILASAPLSFADSQMDAKLEFAGALEETLGHFQALEKNLDEGNSELALIHSTHPISELYETMSMHLDDNPEFNEELKKTLLELKNMANTEVSREEAQSAIDKAKEIIEQAREIVVGNELSNDSAFKAQLINDLLETSKVEYKEAVEEGLIVEMAEFQDGSAFIWRSQQIFEEIKTDIEDSEKISDAYVQILKAYNQKETPEQVAMMVDEAIIKFEIISGVESKHMNEVFGNNTSDSMDAAMVDGEDAAMVDGEDAAMVDGEDAAMVDGEDAAMVDGEDAAMVDGEDAAMVDGEDAAMVDGEDAAMVDGEDAAMVDGEKMDKTLLSPLKQIQEGVEPENIHCKAARELIFKISGEPACVKASSVQKLIERGWAR